MAVIQFVLNAPQSEGTFGITNQQRRAAHAHAARVRHAKTRRLRTMQFQAQKQQNSYKQKEIPDPQTSLLSAGRRDPFMSFVTSLTPTEHMLLDHYVYIIIPLMRCADHDGTFVRRMKTLWVPCAIAEDNLMSTILLASCRHLAIHTPSQAIKQYHNRMAYHYKVKVLASLRDAIAVEAPTFSDSAVAMAIMLTYDELFVQDFTMFANHVKGAIRMVELNGGPHTLGFNGLLEFLLNNLLAKFALEMGFPVQTAWSALPNSRTHLLDVSLPSGIN